MLGGIILISGGAFYLGSLTMMIIDDIEAKFFAGYPEILTAFFGFGMYILGILMLKGWL